MKLGIMQPYLFPYIGYFQLINAVDKFVMYDDVNFIRQGWINRNRVLLNGNAHLFSVPVSGISSYKAINEVELDARSFPLWRTKFYKTLEASYKKAPFYGEASALVHSVFDAQVNTISEMVAGSIFAVSDYLGLSTQFVPTAAGYRNNHLKAQDRVLDICRQEQATAYLNAAGGSELYSKEVFAEHGIKLNFIATGNISYQQFSQPFVPHLSIIDLLMFNPQENIREFLNCYELV
jgi:hypothetical protein